MKIVRNAALGIALLGMVGLGACNQNAGDKETIGSLGGADFPLGAQNVEHLNDHFGVAEQIVVDIFLKSFLRLRRGVMFGAQVCARHGEYHRERQNEPHA